MLFVDSPSASAALKRRISWTAFSDSLSFHPCSMWHFLAALGGPLWFPFSPSCLVWHSGCLRISTLVALLPLMSGVWLPQAVHPCYLTRPYVRCDVIYRLPWAAHSD